MFKVGDKVKVVNKADNFYDMIGTIIRINKNNIYVEFGHKGRQGYHTDGIYPKRAGFIVKINDNPESEFYGWEYDWERVPKYTMVEHNPSSCKWLGYFNYIDKDIRVVIGRRIGCYNNIEDNYSLPIYECKPLLYADRRKYRKKVEYVPYDSTDHLLGMEVKNAYSNARCRVVAQDMTRVTIKYDDGYTNYMSYSYFRTLCTHLDGTPCGKVKK